MRVSVDGSRCIGCGMCQAAGPGGVGVVEGVATGCAQPSKAQGSRAFDAANGCPVNAIQVAR